MRKAQLRGGVEERERAVAVLGRGKAFVAEAASCR